jgi:hypothetical protein
VAAAGEAATSILDKIKNMLGEFEYGYDLNGKFFFKAKKEYYGDMMYFYGFDRCDGFWENNGLCLVYPKSYVGTSDEEELIKMFDELVESYVEIRK